MRREVGDRLARVASIGLAGENGLPFAAILCDHGRMAGRTGMGAVMGAKNLKAVAVRGHEPIPLFDPARFAATRRRTNIALAGDPVTRALRGGGPGPRGPAPGRPAHRGRVLRLPGDHAEALLHARPVADGAREVALRHD